MNSGIDGTGWIWGDWNTKADLKGCFRGFVPLRPGESVCSLDIWADARYYLWVDDTFVGTGPQRSWPKHPQLDRYNFELEKGRNGCSIAVLVWHFGTSTSQYIHGSAGLYLAGEIAGSDDSQRSFVADRSWRAAEHLGYSSPVPRINVSQPWIEMVDANRFPVHWTASDFDDGLWQNAEFLPILPERESIPLRTTPMLTSRILSPVEVLEERKVHSAGVGLRIDYKKAFYPSDTSTEDRYQTGYIATVVVSPVMQSVRVTLADRLWPEITERILLNGEAYSFSPGTRCLDLLFKKGENLFLLDVTGARQRFTSDLHFDSHKALEFQSPLDGGDSDFYSVGPFDVQDIGNIVCMDGFEDIRPGLRSHKAGLVRTKKDLESYRHEMTPLRNVLVDGVKLRSIGATVVPANFGNRNPLNIVLPGHSDPDDEEIILDMGGEVSGYLCAIIEAASGTEIDFRFAENINEGQLEIPDDLDTSLRIVCGADPMFFRSLLRRGFRYVAIRCQSQTPVHIKNLSIDERLYPSQKRGAFESDNAELNKIWEMCRRTVELCSEDTFVDCPAFEQAFWIGDAYVMGLYRQYLYGDTSLTRHCLLLAAQSLERSPLPECHLPAGVSLILTAWSQLWILACRAYWMFTGDLQFVAEIYPWLAQSLGSFRSHIGENELLNISAWNLLDWAPVDTPYHGINAHLNARLAECFRAVGELASSLGRTGEADTLQCEALHLARRSHEAFWDSSRKAYRDCIHADGRLSEVFSVQTNLLMLQYGCTPKEHEQDVHHFVTQPPDFAVLPGSPFLAHFVYDYLFSKSGDSSAIGGILNQWRPMLRHGTCWETFAGFYKDRLTRSYCHGWSAAPAYLLSKWVLGIQPIEPGFQRIRIVPHPGGLSRARGSVPAPQGDIDVQWEIRDDVFHCTVKVPIGIEWEILEPAGSWKTAHIDVKQKKLENPRL